MESWPAKPRVLIAGARAEHERMAAILSGYVRRFAGSFEETVHALEDREFALVIILRRFAAARELVQWLQARDPRGSIPVAQIDLRDYPDDHRGNRRLRRVFDELIESSRARAPATGATEGETAGPPRAV